MSTYSLAYVIVLLWTSLIAFLLFRLVCHSVMRLQLEQHRQKFIQSINNLLATNKGICGKIQMTTVDKVRRVLLDRMQEHDQVNLLVTVFSTFPPFALSLDQTIPILADGTTRITKCQTIGHTNAPYRSSCRQLSGNRSTGRITLPSLLP